MKRQQTKVVYKKYWLFLTWFFILKQCQLASQRNPQLGSKLLLKITNSQQFLLKKSKKYTPLHLKIPIIQLKTLQLSTPRPIFRLPIIQLQTASKAKNKGKIFIKRCVEGIEVFIVNMFSNFVEVNEGWEINRSSFFDQISLIIAWVKVTPKTQVPKTTKKVPTQSWKMALLAWFAKLVLAGRRTPWYWYHVDDFSPGFLSR